MHMFKRLVPLKVKKMLVHVLDKKDRFLSIASYFCFQLKYFMFYALKIM
jgi:hypothetical protein